MKFNPSEVTKGFVRTKEVTEMLANPIDKIIRGDCIEILNRMAEKSADLIFADPPYNLRLRPGLLRPNQTTVDGVNDHWDRFSNTNEYDDFTMRWLSSCQRVLADHGTMWVIGTYHNVFSLGYCLQKLGFWILNDVVWVKANPMPNFKGVRLCNAHETLIWVKKSEQQKKYTFNYHALKLENKGLQMRSDWYFPICSGPERLKDETGKVHSTQKPEALLERIIRGCSKPGDLILDPFFGTGTTGAVAKRLGRHFVGVEKDRVYVEAALRRIAKVEPEVTDPFYVPPPLPRVPFKTLIELGLIEPEATLHIGKTSYTAKVDSGGNLVSNGYVGSIHKVGAQVLGLPACNGWEHWLYETPEGELKSIDELRKEARAKLNIT